MSHHGANSPPTRSTAGNAACSSSIGTNVASGLGPIDISVCIANWNCRELLAACLQSLRRQSGTCRVETVVVDNASADGAADMVAANFPEVVLVRNQENRGFSRANNQAAALAHGRYLFFLNNDTVVPDGALARLVEFADSRPGTGLIGPRLRDPSGRVQVSYRQRPTVTALLHRSHVVRWTGMLKNAYRRYRREEFRDDAERQVEVLMGAAVLMPRAVFDKCGGWDEDFSFGGEDVELSVRVGRHYPLLFWPGVEIVHYGRVSTRLHVDYTSAQMATGFVRYLRKTGTSRPALFAYKLAMTFDIPLQLADKAAQYVWRRAWGRHDKAAKTWLVLRGLGHFVRGGLIPFWQA
jgi:GT2 family glycosyltransferase